MWYQNRSFADLSGTSSRILHLRLRPIALCQCEGHPQIGSLHKGPFRAVRQRATCKAKGLFFFPLQVWTTVGETKRKRHFSPSLSFLIHSSKKNLRLVVDPKHNNRLTLSSFKHGQLCFQHGTRSHKQNNDHTIQKHTNESLHNENPPMRCAEKMTNCKGLS